jgi:hypothetical protein
MAERRPYLNLFTCRKKKNEWSESSLISELSGDFFVSQSTVSPDGKTMIFSTNKESEKEILIYGQHICRMMIRGALQYSLAS